MPIDVRSEVFLCFQKERCTCVSQIDLSLLLSLSHNVSPSSLSDFERADQPEWKISLNKNLFGKFISWDQPEEKVDGLNTTDDRESSQEPHGASNKAYLGLKLDLLVSLNVVKCCCVKVDMHQMKLCLQFFSWCLKFQIEMIIEQDLPNMVVLDSELNLICRTWFLLNSLYSKMSFWRSLS